MKISTEDLDLPTLNILGAVQLGAELANGGPSDPAKKQSDNAWVVPKPGTRIRIISNNVQKHSLQIGGEYLVGMGVSSWHHNGEDVPAIFIDQEAQWIAIPDLEII